MYSPVLGTFFSRDPLAQNGEPDILYDNNWFGDRRTLMRNLYSYASGNPTNRVDPLGLTDFAAGTGSCGCDHGAKPPKKKKKYCLFDFKSRSGRAKECLGFGIGDVYCSACPKSGKCKKETALDTESNGQKCKITFTRQKAECDVCPAGGKDMLGEPVDPDVEV